MEQNRFNIKDKVLYANEIYEVDEIILNYILESCYIYVLRRIADGKCQRVPEYEIVSIILTQAILEKNGWKKEQGDYIDEDHHLMLCAKHEGYVLYKVINERLTWLLDIYFVHQLQHLLFGLGINTEIEV